MPTGGSACDRLITSDLVKSELTVADFVDGMQVNVKMPLHLANQSKYIRASDVVSVAERLMYKCALTAYANWNGALMNRWNTSNDDVCVLFRRARALKLPAMARTVSVGAAGTARGQTFGLTFSNRNAPYVMHGTAKSKELIREVARQIGKTDPQFRFTSLQVGLNARSLLHCDKNNAGISKAIALGPFEGGHLTFYQEGPRTFATLDVGKWNDLDGHMPHQVLPFAGERIAIIAYTHAAAFTLKLGSLRIH